MNPWIGRVAIALLGAALPATAPGCKDEQPAAPPATTRPDEPPPQPVAPESMPQVCGRLRVRLVAPTTQPEADLLEAQRSHARLLRSARVLSGFLGQPATAELAWVRARADDPATLLTTLSDRLAATPAGHGELRLCLADDDEASAAELVNRLMSFYRELRLIAPTSADRARFAQLSALLRRADRLDESLAVFNLGLAPEALAARSAELAARIGRLRSRPPTTQPDVELELVRQLKQDVDADRARWEKLSAERRGLEERIGPLERELRESAAAPGLYTVEIAAEASPPR